jgi:putative ABC transport system permease protein
MRGQAFAIALVIAAGVATLILAIGAHRSLDETRRAYYDRYRFADAFAQARRVPDHLREALARIPGISAVETRIAGSVILDIAGLDEPAAGRLVSLPKVGEPALNALFLREGRLPDPRRDDEVAVNESFAKAHGFRPGSRIAAVLNGRKRALTIVGIALSPEFIYALGPGDIVPDDRRFGILWYAHDAAAAAFDLKGAFNDAAFRLRRDAVEADVLERIDVILAPYGGQDSYTRADQQSHAFIDAELTQLAAMARIIPPIFMAVAAFLLNMALARIIALEREQIGLLKALGYTRIAIGLHYLKFTGLIAIIGIVIGFGLGTWLGRGLTTLYGDFFHFPFLVFLKPTSIYAVAGGLSLAAALAGGLRAVYQAVDLPPAVAMSPPAPVRYQRSRLASLPVIRALPQSSMMILRHLTRYPTRAFLTIAGIASAVSLLVVSLFSLDSVEFMIDITYFRTMRQDVSLSFTEIRSMDIRQELERLPGVLAAEMIRAVPVTLRNGAKHKRVAITGLAQGTDMQKLLDRDLRPMTLPETGLALSEKLAEILGVEVGQTVRVEVKAGRRRQFDLPVTAIVQGYLGLGAYTEIERLNAALGDGRAVSGANLLVDGSRVADLHRTLKALPAIAGLALLPESLKTFRATMARNITVMTFTYVALAVIVTFGVVYNSARIQLSERGRELASLRILGFTRGEVSKILLGETAILVLLAIPLGWAMGYGLALLVANNLDTELYRIPFIIERATYAKAAAAVIAAAVVSALLVRRRIDKLDLIAVLKTRE